MQVTEWGKLASFLRYGNGLNFYILQHIHFVIVSIISVDKKLAKDKRTRFRYIVNDKKA
jgi:hypothetical protein